MRSPREPGSPLEPFATTVGVLATYSLIVLGLVGISVLTGPATLAWGGSMVCMETYSGRLPVWDEARGVSWSVGSRSDPDAPSDAVNAATKQRATMCLRVSPHPTASFDDPADPTVVKGVYILPAGKRILPGPGQLCVDDAPLDLRIASMLTSVPSQLGGLAFLLMAHFLLRRTARDGLFNLQTVSRLRTLGWALIFGELAVASIETLARGYFVSTQLPCATFVPPQHQWKFSTAVLLAGVGVLTFARIMRVAVAERASGAGT